MNALYLGILWMVYYFLHSALATHGIKKYFKLHMAGLYPYYRAMYSFFAGVNFMLLFYFHLMAPSSLVYSNIQWGTYPAYIFIAAGVAVTVIALRNYGSNFLYLNPDQAAARDELKVKGINGYVRHPLYFGLLLMIVGLFLLAPKWKNLVFAIVTLIYIIIGSLIEEHRLINQYGNAYVEYRRRVKMLIPYLL